jgi:hypothetical protein
MTETVTTPADATPKTDETNAASPSATLVMGPSGSGKSSLLATAAEYCWETFKKVALYYCADGGGYPTQMQALINHGIVRVWRVRSRSGPGLVPETIHRASQGWWPVSVDPRTGETAASVKLVPPMTETYETRCPNGHLVQVSPIQAFPPAGKPCPTCAVLVSAANMQVTRTSRRTKGFENVGAVLHDGLTSYSSWLMDDLSRRNLGGEQSNLGGIVESGSLRFGSNNRAQYGFTQARAENWILNAQSIPGMVMSPIWTALPKEGDDESLTVVGPDFAGSAKIAAALQWFGNTFEVMEVEKDGKKYRRIMLSPYVDAAGRRHMCKTRSAPGYLPAYVEDEVVTETGKRPDGRTFVDFSLGAVFRMIDRVRVELESDYKGKYPDAPGLGAGEVGDAAPEGPASSGVTAAGVTPASPIAPVGAGNSAPRPLSPAELVAQRQRRPSVATPPPVGATGVAPETAASPSVQAPAGGASAPQPAMGGPTPPTAPAPTATSGPTAPPPVLAAPTGPKPISVSPPGRRPSTTAPPPVETKVE